MICGGIYMLNFEYYTPTKVKFGLGVENLVGEYLAKYGAKKVLVHFGGGSAIKSGLLDRVTDSLAKSNIQYVTLGGVEPNPKLSLVYEGIDLCKKENVDFILAVGGGSVIDSAKAIGCGVNCDFDVWKLMIGEAYCDKCLPIATVLTLAAAGSEMSKGFVITNTDTNQKLSYGHEVCRPKISFLNPELTYTLPAYQTFSGIVDIIMHTLERYFTTADTMAITDGISVAVIKNMIQQAYKVKANPLDYKARAEIMWTGSLSHNGLTGCGCEEDWATHDIEHTLSGKYDVTHGAGLAALWGSWARYVFSVKPARFVQFARDVFDLTDTNEELLGLKGIQAMENFFHNIGMPTSISEMGIELTDEIIEELANIGTFNDTITLGSFKKLNKQDLVNIFDMAR